MGFRLVIFDVGGVLVRLEPQRFIQKLAGESGKSVEEITRIAIAPTMIESLELGRLGPKQFLEHLKEQLGIGWSFEEFTTAWNGILSENTDTTWLLQRMHERYQLLAMSNTNVLHHEHILRTWPAFSHLHHWVASYQVGYRKPEPEIYQFALRQADVPPHAAVFVDDLEGHVAMARRLGLTAIHFTDGLELERELRAVGLHV